MEDVTHRAYLGDIDGYGTPSLDDPVTRQALVGRREGLLPTRDGTEVRYRAVVSFVQPVAVGVHDEIVLSDGMTGRLIVPQGGLVDPETGQPFLTTVYLGAA